MKIGQGWDLHRMSENLTFTLGGVKIESDKGEVAHSDGDVLIHAIIDAILGATCNEDIGAKFPDTDKTYESCSSLDLLNIALSFNPVEIMNLDCTIILQSPKLRPFINDIRASLAKAMCIPINRISVKAKTSEHILGELGSGDAIIAQAVVLLNQINEDETWV
ncbi:MAG: 2-C-methyl-D-erythritol 2,4-cyclodiphosphate synthase [Spirochaetaceae bacterium]|nr:2-C-methyl-D-erythritol 2,4-cyclodiphosphate synthase [Spirochaetaceae bacterium]